MRTYILAGAAALATVLAAAPATAAPVAATTDSDGRALILIPLTLTKITDLDFGSLVPSSSPGTVTIDATTGGRSVAGGVTGVASDAGFRATFGGAGTPNQQVIVAIAPPVSLSNGLGDTIPVLGMTMDGPAIRTIDPISHTFFLGIGGTLQIAANQAVGDYTADFTVVAIYQ